MYMRRRVPLASIIADTWRDQLIIFVWTGLVILLHEGLRMRALAMPILPITVMGIAVSVYLAGRTKDAYDRWWEARNGLGLVAALTRTWAMQVRGLLSGVAHDSRPMLERQLILGQIGILYAFAYELRRTSRLHRVKRWAIFSGRRPIDATTLLATPAVFQPFVAPADYEAAIASRTSWVHLLSQQAVLVHQLTHEGLISQASQQLLMQTLNELQHALGQCERIKNTPFPGQMTYFGKVFTWIFVLLVPPALLDALVHEVSQHSLSELMGQEYVLVAMSVSQLVGWVFLTTEKIGESTQDPFEGGVHDVPLATVCRAMEIELRQIIGETDLPPPPQPIDDVLY